MFWFLVASILGVVYMVDQWVELTIFFISENLLSAWKIECQCNGSMDVSDHNPILIKGNMTN